MKTNLPTRRRFTPSDVASCYADATIWQPYFSDFQQKIELPFDYDVPWCSIEVSRKALKVCSFGPGCAIRQDRFLITYSAGQIGPRHEGTAEIHAA